jgi:hypothetical protein
MPDMVRRHLKERPGYANYYFNKLNRDRVLDEWRAGLSDLTRQSGVWTVSGETGAGSSFRLVLSDESVALELPDSRFDWTATDNLAESLVPEGSGGMLPALYLWRYLATNRPDEFGEVYYLGTAPFPGCEQLADVIIAIRRGIEGRFFFDPRDGRLLGLEMWSDTAGDPCEIRFSDHRDSGHVPSRIEVLYGETPFADLKIDALE